MKTIKEKFNINNNIIIFHQKMTDYQLSLVELKLTKAHHKIVLQNKISSNLTFKKKFKIITKIVRKIKINWIQA